MNFDALIHFHHERSPGRGAHFPMFHCADALFKSPSDETGGSWPWRRQGGGPPARYCL